MRVCVLVLSVLALAGCEALERVEEEAWSLGRKKAEDYCERDEIGRMALREKAAKELDPIEVKIICPGEGEDGG